MATARLAALPRAVQLLRRVGERRGAPRGSALHTKTPSVSPKVTTSYIQGPTDIPLLDRTVGQCLEQTAERFPDREALVFCRDGVRKTFAQFKEEVDQAAAGLLALGLRKGDRLGMWGPNKYEWVLMQFATAQAGIILVSVNPAYQASELEFVLRKQSCWFSCTAAVEHHLLQAGCPWASLSYWNVQLSSCLFPQQGFGFHLL